MPISFYPLLDGDDVDDLAAFKLVARVVALCQGESAPEISLFAACNPEAHTVASIAEAGGVSSPVVPDTCSVIARAELQSEDSSNTADSLNAEMRQELSAFLVGPNDLVAILWQDVVVISGAPAPFVNSIMHVDEGPVMTAAAGIFYEEVADSIELDGADTSLVIAMLREWVQFDAGGGSSADGAQVVSSRISLASRVHGILRILIAEGMSFSDASTITTSRILAVVEALVVSGICNSAVDAVSEVVDALTFGAAAALVAAERLQDAISIDSTVYDLHAAFERAVEVALLSGELQSQVRVLVVLSESFSIDREATSQAQAVSAILNAVGASMTVSVDSGVYIACLMNMATKQSSEYRNYPFNSFARVGGRYYGMTTEGIRLLEGESDAGDPINWRLRLARTSLGSLNQKRMRSAYLGYTASGDIRLKVITHNPATDELEAHAYRLLAQPAASAREARIKIGQGLMSVYWGFELESIDSSVFELDLLALEPIIVDKIMKGEGG